MALTAIVLLGCRSTPERPNLVLITVDTLRADRLSPYGYDKVETPAIARLAREGILFERAIADASWTLASLSSVMTGKYPTRHLVRSWDDRLHEDHLTLAEILRSRGYVTAAIVGSYPLDRYFGLAQGFDHYDDAMTTALFEHGTEVGAPTPRTDPIDPGGMTRADRMAWQVNRELSNAYRDDADVADQAIEWLANNRSTPFFLWVHFFGPHEKNKRLTTDLEEYKKMVDALIARYDGDVEEMDRHVGRFLEVLRNDERYTNTAVIFHSDHGQSLREHGIFGHGYDLYDSSVHVPMIVRLPNGKRAGQRVTGIVRNLDIFATALDLTGSDAEFWDSQPLLTARADADRHVYMETHHAIALFAKPVEVEDRTRKVGKLLRGIRTDNHKLILQEPALTGDEDRSDALPPEFVEQGIKLFLYDVDADSGERRNLADKDADRAQALRALLESHRDESDAGAAPAELDETAKERLRSLGYLP